MLRFCGGPFDMELRLACGRELVDLGRTTGIRLFAVVGRQQLWWCHRELGDLDEMRAWDEAAAAHLYAPDLEQRSQIGALALLRGDLCAAERQAHDLSETPGPGGLNDVYAMAILDEVGILRGRVDDPVQLASMLSSFPAALDLGPRIGLAFARRGQLTEAATHLATARERGFEADASVPTWLGWLPAVAAWSEICDVLGDRDAAAELADLLDPLAGRLIDAGAVVVDSIDRVRALLALVRGRLEEAEALGGQLWCAASSETPP